MQVINQLQLLISSPPSPSLSMIT